MACLVKAETAVASGHLTLTQDSAFQSPSAAPNVNGPTSNGTIEWETVDLAKAYKRWKSDRLAQSD